MQECWYINFCDDERRALPVLNHPGFGGSVRYQAVAVSDDADEQVAQTIDLMRQYVIEDSRSLAIQAEARAALAVYPDASPEDAVFRWVRSRVAFATDEHTAAPFGNHPDIPVVEVLIRPVDLSAMCSDGGCRRAGDCDDFSMYGAALLLALGREVSFVTVAADPVAPDRFSHVYLASYTDAGRVPLDISHGPGAGWETSNATRREEWPVGDGGSWLVALLAASAAYFLGKREAFA